MTIDHRTKDPFELLTSARPTDTSLRETWSSHRSDAALTSMEQHAVADAPHPALVPRRRINRRRWVALVSAAAAISAAAVVMPALLGDRGTSATAALRPLVMIAEKAEPVVIPDGQFLHLVTVENPDGTPAGASGGEEYPRTMESWMSAAGHLWRRDTTADGTVRIEDFGVQDGSLFNLRSTPVTQLDLPADPEALAEVLRRDVTGSTSKNEATFVAIAELSRTGVLPPRVRAASLEVLASLPEVTATKIDVGGQSRVRVVFTDESRRKDETRVLFFDSTTAQLVEEAGTFRGVTNFRSVITRREVVAEMPSGLADRAAKEAAKTDQWILNCNGSIPTPPGFDCSVKPDSITTSD